MVTAEMPTSGHYMKSYMEYILSKFAIIVLLPEIIFVTDLTGANMLQKPYYE